MKKSGVFKLGQLIVLLLLSCTTYAENLYYGVQHLPLNHATPYFIQMGSYHNEALAIRTAEEWRAKGFRVQIKKHGTFFRVIIGPLLTEKRTILEVREKDGVISEILPLQHHWFVQFQGGAVLPVYSTQMFVANGSDYPLPENLDTYSTKKQTQGTFGLTAGKRLPVHFSYLTDATISGRLQYISQPNIGGNITQYSDPAFLNYTYNYHIGAVTLTADTKLNFMPLYRVSPYMNGGLGVSFNRANSYAETALPGVTPRISPAFQSRVTSAFTYHVGAGLDYAVSPQWLVSVGYEYENLGNVSSGHGLSTWSEAALELGRYQANTILVGISYFM